MPDFFNFTFKRRKRKRKEKRPRRWLAVKYQDARLQSLNLDQRCFTSTETLRTIRDGQPRTATSTFTHVQCCFIFTETIRTIRDGEPRTVTSTFTQFKFSVVSRPQKPYGLLGTGSPGRPPRLSHNDELMLNVLRCHLTY